MAKKSYKSERAAKAALTRLVTVYAERAERNKDSFNPHLYASIDRNDYAIAEYNDFKQNVEKTRHVKNLLNPDGKGIDISVNTPNCCDPSTETYHCM
jgi:hypothetical protein